jgi:hypothetical protein
MVELSSYKKGIFFFLLGWDYFVNKEKENILLIYYYYYSKKIVKVMYSASRAHAPARLSAILRLGFLEK